MTERVVGGLQKKALDPHTFDHLATAGRASATNGL